MKRKNIAVSEEVYRELIDFRAELQKQNSCSISFNDTIDLMLNELASNDTVAAMDRLETEGYRY